MFDSLMQIQTEPVGLPHRGFSAPARLLPYEPPRGRRLRVALYSHDAVGLGHIRRNLLIAQSLERSIAGAETLLISGAGQSQVLPPSVRGRLVLPGIRKLDGCYVSVSGAPLAEVLATRVRRIRAALDTFQPDLLIVDKVPLGVGGELDEILESLQERGTHCVLGLRDILDDPSSVAREWASAGNEAAIDRYYDSVWVYGDRAVVDVAREYGLADATARKLRYTGYLNRCISNPETLAEARIACESVAPDAPYVLCTLGGGEDGGRLAETFCETRLPGGLHGVLLAGPFMPEPLLRQLHERAASNPRLRVVNFLREPRELLRRAERVISMGGYNSVCEIVSHEKRALIVPRVTPRTEQLIRARRFAALGLLDYCHPSELDPGALQEWLARDVSQPCRDRIDLLGLERLPGLLAELGPVAPDLGLAA